MPRAGRGLEQLVQGLERLLAETPVEIRSPDFIVGKNTKTRREVDVSLRCKAGSVDILVILECRDRQSIQDVTWIEQLASKREDVGADKAVAVSATGFSQGAHNLAQLKQIELRSFAEIDEAVVFAWLKILAVEYRTRHMDVVGVTIDLADLPPEMTPMVVGPSPDGMRQVDEIFRRKSDGKMMSIDDIWVTAHGLGAGFDQAFRNLPPGEKERSILTINFDNPQFEVDTTAGRYNAMSLTIDANFYYYETSTPISRRYSLSRLPGTITENAEATIEREGGQSSEPSRYP